MSLINFHNALTFTLTFEGDKSNNPKDPGGKTRKGITQRTYSAWRKKNGQTDKDVFSITDQEVAIIYQHDYWDAIGASSLPSGVDLLSFDIAVNMGPGRANQWLTTTKLLAPKDRLKALDAQRLGFWRHLRIFSTFGRGWLRRETACLALAKTLVAK